MTLDDVVRVARRGEPLVLSSEAWERVARSRQVLEGLIAAGTRIYGVTTGVGDLAHTPVTVALASELSANIVMSHACGVGEPLLPEQARAIVTCAVYNFAQGHSGVRLELVSGLVDLLNHDVVPWIPGQGGMGSLTHMAHVGLVLMGMGEAWHAGRLMPGGEALQAAGLEPLTLREKEGLALVNGTVSKTGLGSLLLYDAERLARWADAIGAMSFEALCGIPVALDARIHAVRPHPGQNRSAASLRRLIEGSEIIARHEGERLQDPLSLRAMPQVHGACRDALARAIEVLNVELNSATDNPLVFDEGAVLSGCNAHGEPLALVFDQAAVAIAELAAISERRTDRLVNRHVSGLPPFLVTESGVSCGFMIPQYVAASLVAENKVLCHPISVDSIPTTAFQEDHWSMGTPGVLKAGRVLQNAQKVLAIELVTAAQALEFHRPHRPGAGTRVLYEMVREAIPAWQTDRVFYPDLHRAIKEVTSGNWLERLEAAVGSLR
ncbi:MAG: histidine ammonia-lyase [Candidatus Xenobia bacterium]